MRIFHELRAVKWEQPALRIVSALFPQNSWSQCPVPNTGKTSRFGGFAPLSEVSIFFPFFPFFPFFLFFGGFEFPHFLLFWWERFRGNRPTAQSLFSYPRPPPKPKTTHPKQPNAVEMQPCKLIIVAGSPPNFPSMPTQMCCVSARRPKDPAAKGRRR